MSQKEVSEILFTDSSDEESTTKASTSKPKTEYDCPQCQKSFSRKFHMERHIILIHEMKSKKPQRPKTHQCEYCDLFYTTKSSLKRHKDQIHLNKKWELCCVCSKTLPEENITQHIEKCHNDKSDDFFYCPICVRDESAKPDIFLTLSSLQRHFSSNHKKKFKCLQCSKLYLTNEILRQHVVRRHQNKGRYRCQLCGKKIKTKYGLKIHVGHRHGTFHLEKEPFKTFFSNN